MPRILADCFEQRQHAAAVIIPLHNQPRLVIFGSQLRHQTAPVPVRPRARKLRALHPRFHIHHLRRRVVAFASAACWINRDQILLPCNGGKPDLQARRCVASPPDQARRQAALRSAASSNTESPLARKQLSSSSAYSCRASPRKFARICLPESNLLQVQMHAEPSNCALHPSDSPRQRRRPIAPLHPPRERNAAPFLSPSAFCHSS